MDHFQGDWFKDFTAAFAARRSRVRASDEERDAVIAQLTEHHLAGRLSADELRERIHQALMATTVGELHRVTEDLPRPRQERLSGPAIWTQVLRRPALAPGLEYAGFSARAGAFCVDFVGGNVAAGVALQLLDRQLFGLFWLADPLYLVACWATTGTTAGMALLGMRVVREEDGKRLGLRRSVVRGFGFILDVVSFGLGFVWAGVDPRRQAWHDKVAGSVVVRRLRRG